MFARWRFERALRSLRQSDHSVLRDYANAAWPQRDCRATRASYLALDFELDGLRKDAHLLQAGWVPFVGTTISLEEAHSVDIRSSAELDDTAVTIHGIGEQRAANGQRLRDVVPELIAMLAGRVMVAHGEAIERHALQRATRALYGVDIPIWGICTLLLEKHLKPRLVGSQAYRLGPSRHRYGLPEYRAHDALTDAIAAAELFQAQLSRLPADATLGQLERR
ncbi:exonuclease domain-containing protein [Qipengyuania sp.]|uniref:exonuclease domain-containing protein n=1 Tax=Qipengyuania sp. TaxID=2004515 RepID=UPI003C7A5F52